MTVRFSLLRIVHPTFRIRLALCEAKSAMPKFLAIHTMPTPPTIEQATPIAKMVKANSTTGAYWVRSWAQTNAEGKIEKLFCEWNAQDVEGIKKALEGVPLQTEGIYPMTIVDSEDYR